jgi:hypothetical protein
VCKLVKVVIVHSCFLLAIQSLCNSVTVGLPCSAAVIVAEAKQELVEGEKRCLCSSAMPYC